MIKIRPSVVVYAIVGTISLVGALVVIILTGHEAAPFVAAVLALAPVLYGIIAALSKIGGLEDQTQQLQVQTDGNHSQLTAMLANSQADLAHSTPTNAGPYWDNRPSDQGNPFPIVVADPEPTPVTIVATEPVPVSVIADDPVPVDVIPPDEKGKDDKSATGK